MLTIIHAVKKKGQIFMEPMVTRIS